MTPYEKYLKTGEKTPREDDSTGLQPTIFAVCENHADLSTRSGWKKISPHVAKYIGQMAQALRDAP